MPINHALISLTELMYQFQNYLWKYAARYVREDFKSVGCTENLQ